MSAADSHKCPECVFVDSKENIFVDRKLFDQIGPEPICLGKFTMSGWVGHSRFYLVECECGAAVVDYPHGYTSGGHIYFWCGKCQTSIIISDRAVYEFEGIKPPPGFLEKLWWFLKLRLSLNRQVGVNRDRA